MSKCFFLAMSTSSSTRHVGCSGAAPGTLQIDSRPSTGPAGESRGSRPERRGNRTAGRARRGHCVRGRWPIGAPPSRRRGHRDPVPLGPPCPLGADSLQDRHVLGSCARRRSRRQQRPRPISPSWAPPRLAPDAIRSWTVRQLRPSLWPVPPPYCLRISPLSRGPVPASGTGFRRAVTVPSRHRHHPRKGPHRHPHRRGADRLTPPVPAVPGDRTGPGPEPERAAEPVGLGGRLERDLHRSLHDRVTARGHRRTFFSSPSRSSRITVRCRSRPGLLPRRSRFNPVVGCGLGGAGGHRSDRRDVHQSCSRWSAAGSRWAGHF